MITFEQYKLTSVIKLWIADCKSYKMKKMLFRMLYYLYCDQNYFHENEVAALKNVKNSFLSNDSQRNISENDNDEREVIKNNTNIDVKLSHRNETLFTQIRQPINKQTKRKSLDEFPESIRCKIKYYEDKLSCKTANVNTDKTRLITISSLPEAQNRVISPPPVVVGMILKANIDKHTMMTPERESINTVVQERFAQINCNQSVVNHESSSFTKLNSSVLSNKDKGNERFLINLLEPKLTKQYDKEKKISNSSIISMTSKLFIKGFSMDLNETVDNSDQNLSQSTSNDRTSSFNTTLETMKTIHNQRLIAKQAAKAVQTCKKSSYFHNSVQRAEAERILLTSSLKRDHLLVQLQKSQDKEQEKHTADLTISNIKFPLNTDEIDSKHRKWFLITCATESTFHISSMLELTEKISSLQLSDMYTFENLRPDFKIKLCVYQLVITDDDYERTMQLTRKIKRRFKRRSSDSILEEKVASSFKICGWVDLTLGNFKNSALPLNKNGTKSPFDEVSFSGSAFSMVLNHKHSGFITFGFEVNDYVMWDKNWCKLINSVLHLWSNPSEECLNESKQFIDLRNCDIVSAGRTCMRSNTLVLQSTSVSQKRYYLSCDSVEDFTSWNCYISSILETLRHWKSLMYV